MGIAHVIGNADQVTFGHPEQLGKRALPRLHADNLSRATQIRVTAKTVVALATSDQRIYHYSLSLTAATDDFATHFVTEDERCRAPFVMTIIGVHIGAADTTGFDPDECFAGFRHRIGLIPIL